MELIGVCDTCQKKYKSANRQGGETKACKCGGTIVFAEDKSEPSSPVAASSASAKHVSASTTEHDQAKVEEIGKAYKKITKEISKKIVGQQEVVEQLLVSVFAGGHCLLEGVPGLAKTLLINSLCQALSLNFSEHLLV